MATSLFPIISTTSLERSLGFYRDLLGGTVAYEFPGPDGAPVYAGIDIGLSHLGIGVDPDMAAPSPTVILWLYVEDCDATVSSMRSAGVTIREEPVDQPWGERVALVEDPDGILVRIATRAAMSPDVESGGAAPTSS
jgi:lactoylglutathione lyase